MESTGIVRKMDDLGRVVIPTQLRKEFNLKEGEPVEIMKENGKIVLRPYVPCNTYCPTCGRKR